jgi:predicted nucleotidyltransferase
MKIQNIYDDLFNSKTKIRILRTIFKHPYREFSEREIAGIIDKSPNTVNKAFKDLRKTNVFQYKRIGRTHLYKCNQNSVLFKNISNFFKDEKQIRENLFSILQKNFEFIGSTVIYGSYAKGDEEFDSDLDILIITDNKPKAEEKIEKVSEEILKRFSIVISPVVFTSKEFKSKLKKPFLKNAIEHGILIAGKGLDTYQ